MRRAATSSAGGRRIEYFGNGKVNARSREEAVYFIVTKFSYISNKGGFGGGGIQLVREGPNPPLYLKISN